MIDTERPSGTTNRGDESALKRLRDRESVRTLSLVQRKILEDVLCSDTSDLEAIWRDNCLRKLLYFFDELLADAESLRAQEDSAADAWPDDTGDSDDE